MDIIKKDKEKVVVLGYKDEVIDRCTDHENILRYIIDPDLKEDIDDCLTHRLFSH